MSNFIGGDLLEITCQHTLGDYRFSPKSGEDFTIDSGGIRANDDDGQVTSDGQMISQLNRKLWSIEGVIAVDLKSQYESDAISEMSGHPDLGVWTFVHISGLVQKGKGRPVGDIKPATNEATMSIKIAGGGKLETL